MVGEVGGGSGSLSVTSPSVRLFELHAFHHTLPGLYPCGF